MTRWLTHPHSTLPVLRVASGDWRVQYSPAFVDDRIHTGLVRVRCLDGLAFDLLYDCGHFMNVK